MNLARSAQRAFVGAHVHLYEMTDGRIGGSLAGLPFLLLGTTGAKSGLSRTTPLGYAEHRDEYLLVASNGGSDNDPYWFVNIKHDPSVTIRVKAAHLSGVARVMMPGERHYDELFSVINAEFGGRYYHYQLNTERPIPLVIVAPAD